MAYNLLVGDREQGYLLPPSVREWLPEGDLAWFIVDSVEQMELREFYRQYREDGWGAAAYDPKMMVGVLLYAYCQKVPSSRKIAQALEAEVRKILAEAKVADEAEDARYGQDRRGDELPAGLGNRTHRLQWLLEAKARLEEKDSRLKARHQKGQKGAIGKEACPAVTSCV